MIGDDARSGCVPKIRNASCRIFVVIVISFTTTRLSSCRNDISCCSMQIQACPFAASIFGIEDTALAIIVICRRSIFGFLDACTGAIVLIRLLGDGLAVFSYGASGKSACRVIGILRFFLLMLSAAFS